MFRRCEKHGPREKPPIFLYGRCCCLPDWRYGASTALLRSDMVIVIANALSCALVASVLYFKLRQQIAGQRT